MDLASRRTTADRRQSLIDDLRQSIRDGERRPGDMLPTIREFSQRYELSLRTVSQELGKLVDEGALRTMPRVGMFVASPVETSGDVYMVVGPSPTGPYPAPYVDRIRQGFEERVAALGGVSLTMPIDAALEHRRAGELPKLAGVLDASYSPEAQREWGRSGTVPRVRFAPSMTAKELRAKGSVDTIYFDDAGGGRQATQHLIRHGHERVAFLGLHGPGRPGELYVWSQSREEGWRATMAASGLDSDGLAFLPAAEPATYGDEVAVATRAARTLVAQSQATAVVAANDRAVLGLLAALRRGKVDPKRWPAIVGFDDLPEVQSYVLTSVRLPWEELGAQAAELLWRRKTGRLTGRAQGYQVPMKLIPRMSSRKDWSASRAARASLNL